MIPRCNVSKRFSIVILPRLTLRVNYGPKSAQCANITNVESTKRVIEYFAPHFAESSFSPFISSMWNVSPF